MEVSLRKTSIMVGAGVGACALFMATDIFCCSDKVRIYSMLIGTVIGGIYGNYLHNDLKKTFENQNIKK